MPSDDRFTALPGQPNLITAADAAAIFVQNRSSAAVEVIGTADDTPPVDTSGGILLEGKGVILNEALSDLFPGVPGVVRVWIWPTGSDEIELKVSYA